MLFVRKKLGLGYTFHFGRVESIQTIDDEMVVKLKRFLISLSIVWIACVRRDQDVPYEPDFKAFICRFGA